MLTFVFCHLLGCVIFQHFPFLLYLWCPQYVLCTLYSHNFRNISSQDTPSADVLSLKSDVTETDEVSGDVNAYFQKVTSSEIGKTMYKCSFLQFKNYIEEWEADRIGLKNNKCRDSLFEKYMHMYLYDE